MCIRDLGSQPRILKFLGIMLVIGKEEIGLLQKIKSMQQRPESALGNTNYQIPWKAVRKLLAAVLSKYTHTHTHIYTHTHTVYVCI